MLREATATLVALERFLACVVPHMPHQRALLPEASAAELAHVGLFFQVCPEVYLLGILGFVTLAALGTRERPLV